MVLVSKTSGCLKAVGVGTSALRVVFNPAERVFSTEEEAIDYLALQLWENGARTTATNMVRLVDYMSKRGHSNTSVVSNAKDGGMMQVQSDGRWGILHIGR